MELLGRFHEESYLASVWRRQTLSHHQQQVRDVGIWKGWRHFNYQHLVRRCFVIPSVLLEFNKSSQSNFTHKKKKDKYNRANTTDHTTHQSIEMTMTFIYYNLAQATKQSKRKEKKRKEKKREERREKKRQKVIKMVPFDFVASLSCICKIVRLFWSTIHSVLISFVYLSDCFGRRSTRRGSPSSRVIMKSPPSVQRLKTSFKNCFFVPSSKPRRSIYDSLST